MNMIPRLEGQGKNTKLIVDGKSFRLRSGEIHNSSASSLEYMENRVWPALKNMNMNSVIAPVYWECVEPEEGTFDFSLVDGLICQAEREKMKLVLLWFGSWKNGGSTYVPEWVKLDQKRFFYLDNAGKREMTGVYAACGGRKTLSPLCEELIRADAKAFSEFMGHLAETDVNRTVVAVQVENEIGVLGCERDFSPLADKLYFADVPDEVCAYARKGGTWEEVFGADAAENFMAYNYANAVEQIAAAGKSRYNLPLYVNAWLEQSPWKPGSYPSGGPQFKMHKIWRHFAKHIDFFAPDIYVKDFRNVTDEYESDENPLFIPEAASNDDVIANYLYSVGKHNALCFAPFGIEDMQSGSSMDRSVLAALNIDESMLRTESNIAKKLAKAYGFVNEMDDLIEKAHEEETIDGFLDNGSYAEYVKLSHAELEITYRDRKAAAGAAAGGFVIELGDFEFLICAVNCSLVINPREGAPSELMLIRKEEGEYRDGIWHRGRILNGDERMKHTFSSEPSMLRFKMMERPV